MLISTDEPPPQDYQYAPVIDLTLNRSRPSRDASE